MANGWYYAHDANKIGPLSGPQLKALAASGEIRPEDTVWKEGIEQGVLASRVKNLFPGAVTETPPIESRSEEPTASAPAILVPAEKKPTAAPPRRPMNRGRAVALKNADMVSQDGTQAKFRKKCMVCGKLDSSCHTITITNKTTKMNFFCPKCRKRREVSIQCTTGK